jgi:hypothetical protein
MRNAEEDMAEQAPDRVWSVNIPKTIAGALAAVCAAVVGSYLGVAGTLIGAAVASIIGTVGTEVYERSITRGGKKLQTLAAPVFIKAPAAVGTPPVAAATEEDSPSHTVPPKQQINWRRVSLVAAAAFLLAMGSLTVVELFTHKSVASMVGNDTKAGSTVGGLFHPGTVSNTPAPTPSTSPSSASPTENTAPAIAPTTTEPASPEPAATTAPTTEPTTEPTTVAPTTNAPPAGTGRNQGAGTQ